MTNDYYDPISYSVPPEEDGFLLKTILQKRLKVSRKLLSRLKLTERGITVNGERRYISVRVAAGDCVQIRMERETSEDILAQPIDFEIIYEDEHLLVVNKEAGRIVHPTHGHYVDTLANGVVHYWAERGEKYRFRPVHRLDQETSGVLVIAKNPYVHQHISEQMIDGAVLKEYVALVHGHPEQPQGVVTGPIDRDPGNPHVRIVTADGYAAVTHYETKEAYSHASLVGLRLETGRTHQIRVHMRHIGCPLIGDKMYKTWDADRLVEDGRAKRMASLDGLIDRHALHACSIGFIHPITRRDIRFTADLPQDMRRLRRILSAGQDEIIC